MKLRQLLIAGVTGLVLGLVLNALGVCPNVKRIWTPTWVLFSGGWCFLFLAAFYAAMEIKRSQWWAFPLLVIGANSIAAYCMDHLFGGFIRSSLDTHLGPGMFRVFGTPYEPFVRGAFVLLVLWLILFWMFQRKLFLKI